MGNQTWIAQGEQVPGNIRTGPEKLYLARKPGIIFQTPDFFQKMAIFSKKGNFSAFYGHFEEF